MTSHCLSILSKDNRNNQVAGGKEGTNIYCRKSDKVL